MATGPVRVKPGTWKWTSLGAEDATAHKIPFRTKLLTVQLLGTFGGTVTMEGSLDNTTWATLTDLQGNSVAKSAAALETIQEVPIWIRPSGGAGTTSVDVWLVET